MSRAKNLNCRENSSIDFLTQLITTEIKYEAL